MIATCCASTARTVTAETPKKARKLNAGLLACGAKLIEDDESLDEEEVVEPAHEGAAATSVLAMKLVGKIPRNCK
ncbi:unannotated protein [freshwater metagenome]|uniref:Unannotated protein n=1 Tax=freshwater metagenome TaxID=449393 RepID=A0A6J6R254_9ZZZZ